MSILLYLVAVISFAVAFYNYLTRNNGYWKKKGIVGPQPKFLFGTLKDLVLHRIPFHEPLEEMYLEYPNEKLVGMYRLITPVLLVRDLDLIQHIFIRDFEMFVNRTSGKIGTDGVGNNLILSTGDYWRLLRSELSPTFTTSKLKNMFHLFDTVGDRYLDYLDLKLKEQSEQDVYKLLQKYTVCTISSCAFGIDIDLNEYDEASYTMLDDEIFKRSLLVELEFLFPDIVSVIRIPFSKYVTKYFFHLIKTVTKDRNGKPTSRGDFMDLLLDIRNAGKFRSTKAQKADKERKIEITDTVLAAQALAFFAGGYETSASTMAYLLHELSLNQEIQNKLLHEIKQVLDRNNGKLSYDALKDMTYMDQVLSEVLRIYPILPLQRYSTAPYTLPGTNVTIPKGTMIVVSVPGIHHDERHYPEPHKFDPERFSPENSKMRHPCAYLPFGLGPRHCIGMQFSKVQSKALLAKLLPRYRVEPARATRRHFIYDPQRIVLSSKYGVPLRLVHREEKI